MGSSADDEELHQCVFDPTVIGIRVGDPMKAAAMSVRGSPSFRGHTRSRSEDLANGGRNNLNVGSCRQGCLEVGAVAQNRGRRSHGPTPLPAATPPKPVGTCPAAGNRSGTTLSSSAPPSWSWLSVPPDVEEAAEVASAPDVKSVFYVPSRGQNLAFKVKFKLRWLKAYLALTLTSRLLS